MVTSQRRFCEGKEPIKRSIPGEGFTVLCIKDFGWAHCMFSEQIFVCHGSLSLHGEAAGRRAGPGNRNGD